MVKNNNKTVLGVIGVLFTLFGIIGTIPILVNKVYVAALPITAIAVIIGVILMAWAISN